MKGMVSMQNGTLGMAVAAVSLIGFVGTDCAAAPVGGSPDREFVLDGEFATSTNWFCTKGSEFPGAKGSIGTTIADKQRELKLDYDFSGGGSYVGAVYRGGFPVETTGLAFTAMAEKACNLFCRVTDGNKTFQGFYRKLKAGEETTARITLKGPWRNSWGRGNASRPEPPIRQLWICIQKEKDLPKVGSVLIDDLKAVSTSPLDELRNLAPAQDFSFVASGWRVIGKWRKNWQVLDIDCAALGKEDAALSLSFPQMGRDDVRRFALSAQGKTCHFTYMPPFGGRGNPYNRYGMKVTVTGRLGSHTETTELIGKHASAVNLGAPLPSSRIGKSIVGVNTHFSYAKGNTGAFAGWHKHRELTDMIAAAGIKWIRDTVSTEKDEDGKPKVKEFVLDWMRCARGKDINVIAEINMHVKETQEEFVEKCRVIAEAMKGITNVFELGNEPNNFGGWRKEYGGTWNGKEKDNSTSEWVKAHLRYTNAGAEAIKQVRPDAICIGLGACPPTNFRYLDLGLSKAVDGVVDHPYTYSMPPERVPYSWSHEKRDGVRTGDKDGSFAGLMLSYIEKFKQTGQMRSLWLTEFGWSCFWFEGTKEKGLYAGFTEEAQAIYLVRRFIQCMTLPDIEVACQYDLLDDYRSARHNPEANFGLLRSDYSPKPSYYAMQRLTSLFGGYEHDTKAVVKIEKAPLHRSMKRSELVHDWDEVAINAANGVLAYGFANPELAHERLLAVWSKRPASAEFNNRFVSVRVSGWQEFSRHPIAIDLITGKTSDVPVEMDGDDLIVNLLLSDNPLAVKLFSDRSETAQ